jgi:hypothetical protein
MTQDDANKLNREQAMEVGRQLAFPLYTGSGFPNTGLTKREYIATQLMTQLIAENDTLSSAAIKAVQATELLLIELNKKQ